MVRTKGSSLKKTGPCCLWMAPCLMIIEAIALLVKDAAKFTLGQELTVIVPHAIERVLIQPTEC